MSQSHKGTKGRSTNTNDTKGAHTFRMRAAAERKIILKLVVFDIIKRGACNAKQIAAELNAKNISTPYGRIWNADSVKKFLKFNAQQSTATDSATYRIGGIEPQAKECPTFIKSGEEHGLSATFSRQRSPKIS